MHAMYSENAVNDIHDLISDDDIDLDQFASMCDPYSHFYSDFSAPQSREHSAWNREHLGLQDSRALSLESREHLAWDRRKAENQLVKQGPHGPTTTPQAAPNPILSGCGMGTSESEGIHVNSDHTTVDTPHIRLHNIHKGELFPYIPHPCKAPESGSVGTHPSPDGTLTSMDAEADVAPRGLVVLTTHTNSLANSLK